MPEPLRTLVFALFGLAFVLPGALHLAMEAHRPRETEDDRPQGPPISRLAAFSIAYGSATWVDLALADAAPGAPIRYLQASLMAASFLALLDYARVARGRLGDATPGAWILAVAAVVTGAGSLAGPDGVLAAASWAIGLPAGFAGACATIRHGRRPGAPAGQMLQTLGLLMGLFAVSTALGAPETPFPPSAWLNVETVSSALGANVQHLRALWALLGVACLVGWGRAAAPAATRRVVQLLLAIAASLLMLGIGTFYYREHLLDRERHEANDAARTVAHQMERTIRRDVEDLEVFARWLEHGGATSEHDAHDHAAPVPADLPRVAEDMIEGAGEVAFIALLKRDGAIEIHPAPPPGQAPPEALLEAARRAAYRSAADRSRSVDAAHVSPVFTQGGPPMLVLARTLADDHGPYQAAVAAVDLTALFERSAEAAAPGFAYALRDPRGAHVAGEPIGPEGGPERASVQLAGASWLVQAAPPNGWDARVGAGAIAFLVLGLLVAALASAGTLILAKRWSDVTRIAEHRSRQLAAVVAQSRDALAIVDARGRVVLANDALEKMTGYETGELDRGRLWRAFFPDAGARAKARERTRLMLRSQGEPQEFEITTKGGGDRWVSVVMTGLQIEGADYQLVSARDITEQKRREVERTAILDAHEDGLLLIDREFTVIWANSRVTGGGDPERLTGRPCHEGLYSRATPCDGCPAREALESGAPRSGEVSHVVGARKQTWELRAVPVSLGHLPSSVIVWSREITERLEMDARLRQGQKMEAVGQLAGGIAHDFNNILTGIIGTADLLLEDLPEDSAQHEDAREIRGLAGRAAELTGQLLTFSRQQPVQISALDLGAVLEEMRQMLGRLIGAHVRLHIRLPQEPVWVEADPAQVQQIVLNLALNARDVMPDGGELVVTLRNRPWPAALKPAPGDARDRARRRAACLEVSDTGPGIDARIQSRIFEPFFTTKPVGQGTGLGLATVYGIVERLGGTVEASSAPGEGATFRVWLPLLGKDGTAEAVGAAFEAPTKARAQRAAPERVPEPGEPEGANRRRFARKRRRVLVVEDERAVRLLVGRILSKTGLRVVLTERPDAALEVFRKEGPFDLVVSDILMPVMRGTELVSRLRAYDPGLPAILISGYTEEPLGSLADEPDVRFLPKPFTAEELTAAAHDLLPEPVRASASSDG